MNGEKNKTGKKKKEGRSVPPVQGGEPWEANKWHRG
jgi:hypothetical protein